MADHDEHAPAKPDGSDQSALSQDALDELVASSDTGGRAVHGVPEKIILGTALAWAAVPALVRVAPSVHGRLRCLQ